MNTPSRNKTGVTFRFFIVQYTDTHYLVSSLLSLYQANGLLSDGVVSTTIDPDHLYDYNGSFHMLAPFIV